MKELFLIAALTMPPAFSGPAPLRGHVLHDIVSIPQFMDYVARGKRPLLVVGGMSEIVRNMRKRGHRAFGATTEDGFASTRWHSVMEAGRMAFQHESFHSVYWLHLPPSKREGTLMLEQAVRLIVEGGFLVFDELTYASWPKELMALGWDRLPFKEGVLTIWNRPQKHRNLVLVSNLL
jgi:hypothetical protein